MSWNDIESFLIQLNAIDTLSEMKFVLPTEAQWEFACRAGGSSYWHSGNTPDRLQQYAWIKTNGNEKTHPVGQLKPNALGLYDMHGNVWEWCRDWWAEHYPGTKVNDPTGPLRGSRRVHRGGGQGNNATQCRSASRYAHPPDTRDNDLGFRLAAILADF